MAYLIVKIEPRGNDTRTAADCKPPIATLSRGSVPNAPVDAATAKALTAKHGFQLHVPFGPSLGRPEWPFIAYVYVSPNAAGVGRGASSLHRWPARRLEE
ncbi:unnamed protein product [marine sediment metagenome]|uniref:Uncharacterized protein n=1 Tax=marine sediment metagenome TaxID=412755 RepID=X0X0T2_9ZZZZ